MRNLSRQPSTSRSVLQLRLVQVTDNDSLLTDVYDFIAIPQCRQTPSVDRPHDASYLRLHDVDRIQNVSDWAHAFAYSPAGTLAKLAQVPNESNGNSSQEARAREVRDIAGQRRLAIRSRYPFSIAHASLFEASDSRRMRTSPEPRDFNAFSRQAIHHIRIRSSYVSVLLRRLLNCLLHLHG